MRAYSFRERQGVRSFLYLTERVVFRQEISWGRAFCHASFGFDDEDGWGVSFALPGLAVWWRLAGVFPRIGKEREVKIAIHGNALWWTVWRDWRDGWSRRVPRWREGSFHFDDFLLGLSKCSQLIAEEVANSMREQVRSLVRGAFFGLRLDEKATRAIRAEVAKAFARVGESADE